MAAIEHPNYTPVNPSDEIQMGILKELQALHAHTEGVERALHSIERALKESKSPPEPSGSIPIPNTKSTPTPKTRAHADTGKPAPKSH